MKASLTYRRSGVHIDKADAFVESIKPLARKTHRPGVLKGIGGFGAFFNLNGSGYRKPVFVSSADGVGTKLLSASQAGRYDVLGVDLVAMNVNDILTSGAEPLFFLDYLAVGRLNPSVLKQVVRGIARGCREAGCALIGGETAEMPGLYRGEDFDLAGFAVGVVEEDRIIDGSRIRTGDSIIGCASSGIHSNGFSLVRKVFSKEFIRAHAAEVLAPTRIYVKPILELLRREEVSGMAHITGGGFYDKIGRILPQGTQALVDAGSWRMPRVFQWIQKKSGSNLKEMHRTFNMGIGYVVVVPEKQALRTLKLLGKAGLECWVIGRIGRGSGVRVQ